MPFPIASALSVLGSGVNYFRDRKKYNELIDRTAGQLTEEQKREALLRKTIPEYTVSGTSREAYQRALQDPAGDYLRQQSQRQAAENVGALKSGGARALHMLGASQRRAQQDLAAVEIGAFGRKQDARKAFGDIEQKVQDLNTGNKAGLHFADLARSVGTSQNLKKYGDELDLKKHGAAGSLIGGAANFAGSLGEYGQEEDWFKEGGIVKETPGNFSHAKNPIDIIRAGRKIGEMTGGEAILTPDMKNQVEKMASEGDTDLHKFLRSIFKKFNK